MITKSRVIKVVSIIKNKMKHSSLFLQEQKKAGYGPEKKKKEQKNKMSKSAWQSNDEYLEKLGFYGKKKEVVMKMPTMSTSDKVKANAEKGEKQHTGKNMFFDRESIEKYDRRYRKEHPGYKSKLE